AIARGDQHGERGRHPRRHRAELLRSLLCPAGIAARGRLASNPGAQHLTGEDIADGVMAWRSAKVKRRSFCLLRGEEDRRGLSPKSVKNGPSPRKTTPMPPRHFQIWLEFQYGEPVGFEPEIY